MWQKVLQLLKGRIELIQPPVVAFGLFGLVNYPLFFLYWHSLAPQQYTNAILRLVAVLLCIPLALTNYWPKRLKPVFPAYWFLSLLYCLPFFGTFMLLKNQASNMWLMNAMLVIFLLILLADWLMFSLLIALGTSLGIIAYSLTTNASFHFIFTSHMSGALSTYVLAIIIGVVFSKNTSRNIAIMTLREQLSALNTMASSIAHELRTPLASIKLGITGLTRFLPTLVQGYKIAKQHNLDVPAIRNSQFNTIEKLCDTTALEVKTAFIIIDLMLNNVRQREIKPSDLEVLSMNACIHEALSRYPFKSDDERNLVSYNESNDFTFSGDVIYMTHILFNLIMNALYFIKAERKGNISIWLEQGERVNTLYFKDTAKGAPAEMLEELFQDFFSKKSGGTGLGLAFCKHVMKAFGGDIIVQSVVGEYMQFVLTFPKCDEFSNNKTLA